MPLVKKQISVAANATTPNILADTTYNYVNQGAQVRLAAAASDDGIVADFNMNNVELSNAVAVTKKVDGEAFSAFTGAYTLNDTVATAAGYNRPIITFTNTTAAAITLDYAVFIGQ